ncbi:phosphatase PAP2 family protein [Sediminibacillus massiliensis]|uniref:phosphatase PAP2 family protein n=1 Tax=Sediminibacillus massiliensis TaxID=1926277 RepID=UPI0009886D7B|nr:phosphatase PAP2 family protein [Sediminibacillus massiliensis]
MNKQNYFYISFFLLALIIVLFLTVNVMTSKMPVIDAWSRPAAESLDDTRAFIVFRWITELGSGTFITPFIIVASILLWIYSKDWLASIMLAGGTLLGYRANYWIKLLVERERPRIFAAAEGEGYSFPSGHAMGSMIAYGLLVFFFARYMKKQKAVFILNLVGIMLILLIGLSRYVIQVHYLTDVLAGYAFGFLFLMIWTLLYKVLKGRFLPSP